MRGAAGTPPPPEGPPNPGGSACSASTAGWACSSTALERPDPNISKEAVDHARPATAHGTTSRRGFQETRAGGLGSPLGRGTGLSQLREAPGARLVGAREGQGETAADASRTRPTRYNLKKRTRHGRVLSRFSQSLRSAMARKKSSTSKQWS
eukprot:gene15768-biopygen23221